MLNKMNKKILLTIIIGMFLISLASVTALDSQGTVKQGDTINLTQICSDATYVTLSTIIYPDRTTNYIGQNMTSLGSGVFQYSFNDTEDLGRYDINQISDGCENTFAYYIEVTLNGNNKPEGILVVIFTLIFIAIFGFGLIYFLKSLVHVIQLDLDLIDCAIMIATYLSMWMFYYFSFEYLGNAFVNNILEMAISIGAVTHVILPLVGFAVSFIMTNLKAKQKARVTY